MEAVSAAGEATSTAVLLTRSSAADKALEEAATKTPGCTWETWLGTSRGRFVFNPSGTAPTFGTNLHDNGVGSIVLDSSETLSGGVAAWASVCSSNSAVCEGFRKSRLFGSPKRCVCSDSGESIAWYDVISFMVFVVPTQSPCNSGG